MTEASRVQKLLIEQNAEIDRLKERIETLGDELHHCFHRIEELQAALLWYAEHCQKGGDDIEGPFGDYGQRARKALEGKDE